MPTGSASGAPASDAAPPRGPRGRTGRARRSVVSYSERRDSRLIPASVLPQAARSTICRRAGSVTDTGSASEAERHLARGESLAGAGSRARGGGGPPRGRASSAMPRSEGSGAGGRSSSNSKRPSPQRKRSWRCASAFVRSVFMSCGSRQVPVGDEQLAQPPLVGLLLEEGAEERLLGDQAVAHQRLADRLARVVGARPLHGAVPEGEALLRGAAGHLEDARLLPAHEPAEEVEEVEGVEVAGEAHARHGSTIRPGLGRAPGAGPGGRRGGWRCRGRRGRTPPARAWPRPPARAARARPRGRGRPGRGPAPPRPAPRRARRARGRGPGPARPSAGCS